MCFTMQGIIVGCCISDATVVDVVDAQKIEFSLDLFRKFKLLEAIYEG